MSLSSVIKLKLTRMRVLRREAKLIPAETTPAKKSIDQRMPSGDATTPHPFPPRVILPQHSTGNRRDKNAGSGKKEESSN
jgi:hypothetical protein